MKKIIILIFLIILSGCCSSLSGILFPDQDFKLRSIEIQIVDASTKKPLKNINVIYMIMVSGLSSDGHNSYDELYLYKEFVSDDKGIVQIPARKVKQGFNRSLNAEIFFVNLELKSKILKALGVEKKNKKESSKVIKSISLLTSDSIEVYFDNIDNDYTGYCISITKHEYEVTERRGSEKDIASTRFIGKNSFSKDKEIIEIELKKK